MKRFIDPNYFSKIDSEFFDSILAERKVKAYLRKTFKECKNGDLETFMSLIDCSHEINATKIGYSKGQSRGKGASPDILTDVFMKILEIDDDFVDEIISNPRTLLLFVKSFVSLRNQCVIIMAYLL